MRKFYTTSQIFLLKCSMQNYFSRLIDKSFTPYWQYYSHITAGYFSELNQYQIQLQLHIIYLLKCWYSFNWIHVKPFSQVFGEVITDEVWRVTADHLEIVLESWININIEYVIACSRTFVRSLSKLKIKSGNSQMFVWFHSHKCSLIKVAYLIIL